MCSSTSEHKVQRLRPAGASGGAYGAPRVCGQERGRVAGTGVRVSVRVVPVCAFQYKQSQMGAQTIHDSIDCSIPLPRMTPRHSLRNNCTIFLSNLYLFTQIQLVFVHTRPFHDLAAMLHACMLARNQRRHHVLTEHVKRNFPYVVHGVYTSPVKHQGVYTLDHLRLCC